MSNIQDFLYSIKDQYLQNYNNFVISIPTALILIPLTVFFMSPTASRGIFLFGAVLSSILALIFTPVINSNNFVNNKPSFHGIALGYVVGYLMMENILLSKLGSMLATAVMGSILAVILTVSIYTDFIGTKILNVGIGWIIGIAIGMFFSYSEFKNRQIEEEPMYS